MSDVKQADTSVKKEFKPTAEQLRAIYTDGRILVSASAGSGKTTAMVDRIMRLIREGASLAEMLVLVYNNASGEELRYKLGKALFNEACSAKGAQRDVFRKQLDALPFAYIGTIHGFCRTLIRENFEKAAVSPSFEVLDENAHAAYMKRALDDVFCRYQEEGDSLFSEVSDIFVRGRKEDNFRDVIVKLFNLIDIQPDKSVFTDTVERCYSSFYESPFAQIALKNAVAKCSVIAKKCDDIIPLLIGLQEVSWADKTVVAGRIARQMSNAKSFGELAELCAAGALKISARRKGKAREAVEAVELAKSLCASLDAAIKDVNDLIEQSCEELIEAHNQNALYVKKLMEITLRFDARLCELKRSDNVLSFEDLMHVAQKLISENPDVKNNFTHVFVDEYQDVNPTQEYIISQLAGENAFMVGDVKQSIYGFRLADPRIFLERQKRYENEKEGEVIAFNRNFRSRTGILNFVNRVFCSVMKIKNSDIDYASDGAFATDEDGVGDVEIRLFADADDAKNRARGVYRISDETDSDERGRAEEEEGRFIANEIKTLVKGMKTDKGALEYGDIAVLFRSRNSAAARIIQTLKEEGIPVGEGKFARYDSVPERELMCCLRAVDNPTRDVPFAGYLLSCFGGYTQEEVARIAKADGDSLYQKLQRTAQSAAERENDGAAKPENGADAESFAKYAKLQIKAADTLKTLRDYRVKASFKSVGELIESVISDSCYDAYLAREGQLRLDALNAFAARVGTAYADKTLSAFLREYEPSDGDAAESGDNRGAVKISTFHAFKGLEAEVVFVADVGCNYSGKSREGDLVAETGGYVGLKYFDKEKQTKTDTLSLYAVRKLVEERERKEELRLFYVALTRARRRMYITGKASKAMCENFGLIPSWQPKSNLQLLSDAACDGGLGCPVSVVKAQTVRYGNSRGAVVLEGGGDERIKRIISKGRDFIYPHSESSALGMKYSVSALNGGDELDIPMFADSDVYAKTGTAYHKVMEKISYSLKSASEAEKAINLMVERGLLTSEQAGLVNADRIARCLNSPIIEFAERSPSYREYPFMMYVPANEVIDGVSSCDKVLVQGVIDLIILGEQKIIVDFKNSRLKDADMLKKYEKQLKLYKRAAETAIGAKIDKTLLYSFKTGETYEIK